MPAPFNKNSLDYLLIYNNLKNNKFLCKLNPNDITILNIIITFILLWLLYKKKFFIAFLTLVIVGRVLDCLDGIVARRCNKLSLFGNFIDHFCDGLFSIGILAIILYKYPNLNIIIRYIFKGVIIILMGVFIAVSLNANFISYRIYKNKLVQIYHDNTILFRTLYAIGGYYFKDIMITFNIKI